MKKTYHIDGMHCKACELLLRKSCEKIDGCQVEKIDHRKGTATVLRDGKEDKDALRSCVEACGYACHTERPSQQDTIPTRPLAERISMILVALVLTYVLIEVDLYSLMGAIQTDTSLGVIVLLGVVASVSTCLAVTGGVIVGFTELIDKSSGRKGHAKLHGSFHLGRVLGFFLFGAVLGLIGKSISLGLGFTSRLNAFIAIVFVYLGLQLLGLVPSLSSAGIHLPDRRTKHILSQRNPYFAPLVGALTFFLPCGFTQSVQLMALASGGPVIGGVMMAAFAIGTIPGLLALGMGTSYAKDHRKQGFEQVVAVILLIFGLFTFRGSASLRGRTDMLQQNTYQPVVHEDTEDTIVALETITLSHNGFQVVPETTTLEAGKSYELIITPESDGLGCMTTILLPRLDSTVHQVLQGKSITYTLEDVQPGQYSFVCGSMGMHQGKLIVM